MPKYRIRYSQTSQFRNLLAYRGHLHLSVEYDIILQTIPRSALLKHQTCPRHPNGYPCTCAMGNVYRFVEPVVLYMLREDGEAHGYQLAASLQEHALTDAEIEGAAMYRTLRRLELHGYVQSSWDVQSRGPARRVYSITRDGRKHLEEWAQVLDNLSKSMTNFVTKIHRGTSTKAGKSLRKRSPAPGGRKTKTFAG